MVHLTMSHRSHQLAALPRNATSETIATAKHLSLNKSDVMDSSEMLPLTIIQICHCWVLGKYTTPMMLIYVDIHLLQDILINLSDTHFVSKVCSTITKVPHRTPLENSNYTEQTYHHLVLELCICCTRFSTRSCHYYSPCKEDTTQSLRS